MLGRTKLGQVMNVPVHREHATSQPCSWAAPFTAHSNEKGVHFHNAVPLTMPLTCWDV